MLQKSPSENPSLAIILPRGERGPLIWFPMVAVIFYNSQARGK